jgi:hypothetical protein
VAQPEAELRRVAAFLGLPWSGAMLEYHRDLSKAVPEGKRHIWRLLDQPPQTSHVARWKREYSASQRVAFEKRAGAMLSVLGYETLPRASGGISAELQSLAGRVARAVRRRLFPK